ncbi:hypothetical protein K7W42_15350 [Deinococcus sp. HMF7604]|uniref:hypothetical protein n=1 Tax=Deinococcus betulae TaxID=2873312 RepID=UPI001CCD8069|nr:hypothetical protein [Deinococcus betulae]MBZ9752230.1 hypothetical protein [Deinococcus betulae]
MINTEVFVPLAFLAFVFALYALGVKLPLDGILRLVETNSREAAALVAFGLFLGFLAALARG